MKQTTPILDALQSGEWQGYVGDKPISLTVDHVSSDSAFTGMIEFLASGVPVRFRGMIHGRMLELTTSQETLRFKMNSSSTEITGTWLQCFSDVKVFLRNSGTVAVVHAQPTESAMSEDTDSTHDAGTDEPAPTSPGSQPVHWFLDVSPTTRITPAEPFHPLRQHRRDQKSLSHRARHAISRSSQTKPSDAQSKKYAKPKVTRIHKPKPPIPHKPGVPVSKYSGLDDKYSYRNAADPMAAPLRFFVTLLFAVLLVGIVHFWKNCRRNRLQ